MKIGQDENKDHFLLQGEAEELVDEQILTSSRMSLLMKSAVELNNFPPEIKVQKKVEGEEERFQ